MMAKIDPQIRNDILVAITCPLCTSLMTKPILRCDKGHSICGKCYEIGGKCKICNSHCDGRHTTHLENISEGVSFPCKFSGKGCKNRCIDETKKWHESECQTIFKCPLNTCVYADILDQIIAHCLNSHKPLFCLKQQSQSHNNEIGTESHLEVINGRMLLGSAIRREYMCNVYTTIFQVIFEVGLGTAQIAVNRYCYPSDSGRKYRFIIRATFNNKNCTSFTVEEECGNNIGQSVENNYVKFDISQFKLVPNWDKITISIRIIAELEFDGDYRLPLVFKNN